jgi:hypothetical protein
MASSTYQGGKREPAEIEAVHDVRSVAQGAGVTHREDKENGVRPESHLIQMGGSNAAWPLVNDAQPYVLAFHIYNLHGA